MVVIGFLLLQKHQKLTGELKVLFLYFILSCINLGVAVYLAIDTIPNLFWYNLNGFCTLLTLSVFFYQLLADSGFQRLVAILAVIGLSAYLLILAFWDDKKAFFSAGYAVSSLLIIVYSLLFFSQVFRDKSPTAAKGEHAVWLVSGLFTYFLGAYVIQVGYRHFTWQYISKTFVLVFDRGMLWGIHNVIYFLACLVIFIGLLRLRKKTAIL